MGHFFFGLNPECLCHGAFYSLVSTSLPHQTSARMIILPFLYSSNQQSQYLKCRSLPATWRQIIHKFRSTNTQLLNISVSWHSLMDELSTLTYWTPGHMVIKLSSCVSNKFNRKVLFCSSLSHLI